MTDAEIEDLREAMREQRREIRDGLADAGVDVSSCRCRPQTSATRLILTE